MENCEKCTRCGRMLEIEKTFWLELSEDDGKYYVFGEFPKGDKSQGYFPFGCYCVMEQLKEQEQQ